jgi:hypothetical protein
MWRNALAALAKIPFRRLPATCPPPACHQRPTGLQPPQNVETGSRSGPKPKNHRQGIAGGFGGLHLASRVSLKTRAVKTFAGCASRQYMIHITECNT